MKNRNILITGGAGFIGSNLLVKLVKKYPNYNFHNIDSLTYASDLNNLLEIIDYNNYFFYENDIKDFEKVNEIFKKNKIDSVIHLAAESHVDNSIENPNEFALTNVLGTLNLLISAKNNWDSYDKKIFYHVSTDEVFGSLEKKGFFKEETPYDPRSPYSASKASSDHFVRAFYHTYKLPVVISNCSNNYGPKQHYEKLIPKVIYNSVKLMTIPVYGNGMNIRDWLFVEDHVDAIDLIFHEGKIGETYLVGGSNEINNLDLVKKIIYEVDNKLKRSKSSDYLIKFVDDRKGHDFRYAIDSSKIQSKLKWKPKFKFKEAIKTTVDYYIKELI